MDASVKHMAVLAASAALFLATVFLPEAGAFADGISRFLFEGTAYGRFLLFLGWIFLLFGLSLLVRRFDINVPKIKHAIPIALALLLICWGLQVHFQSEATATADFPFDATVAVFSAGNGNAGWEASQLQHIHITKGLLYPVLSLLPMGGFDTGEQMHALAPAEIGMVFLVLAAVMALLMFIAFLDTPNFPKKFLLAFFSFCALVSVFDGGPFTIVGRIAFALGIAYLAYPSGLKGWQFFAAPFLALAGLLYTCSFFMQSSAFMFAAYEALAIALLLSLALVFRSERVPAKAIWLGVFAVVLLYSHSYFLDFGYGAVLPAGEPAKIMVYGLPESADATQLSAVFAQFGAVENLEHYNYLAFATLTPAKALRTHELEQKLNAQLKPDSYLHVVKSWQGNSGVLRSEQNLEPLLSINSAYVQFRREEFEGEQEIVAEGMFPHPYLSLFALNHLHYVEGIDAPVVFSRLK
ncbi:hypothetical protein KJ891_00240 [Candidatus Micrarchaeota archaeon]|nr:hypothetical protein [Candidatus Micrarchaeota archaeon]